MKWFLRLFRKPKPKRLELRELLEHLHLDRHIHAIDIFNYIKELEETQRETEGGKSPLELVDHETMTKH